MSFADLPPEQGIAEMSFPTRVVVGAGALSRLPAHVAKQKMARPLVVTDQGVVKAGLASLVYKVLTAA